jgi:putative tryptophan/tyrosine transport system substrate-binding protein
MRRREFIAGLGVAAWPLAVRAQQANLPIIGFLGSDPQKSDDHRLRAFAQGLAEIGYVEGQNVAIEYRWAGTDYDRFATLAADLVHRGVSVIFAGTTPAVLAAMATTKVTPIVFGTAIDPISGGLVSGLDRPGGNLTGIYSFSEGLTAKRLELLHETVPTSSTIAALLNEANRPITEVQSRALQSAADTLGLKLLLLSVRSERDFDSAFATLVERGAGGLVISQEASFITHAERLAELTLRFGIPAISSTRVFTGAGGLMSYEASLSEMHRVAGTYAGRILKGEKVSSLPVQQSTKIELIINLKTAKALGLTFPTALLVRADEVIE